MTFNHTGVGFPAEPAGAQVATLPSVVERMVDQVRLYEAEFGLVEPIDPSEAATAGYSRYAVQDRRIATIKGILVATGQGSKLVRLETYADPAPAQSLLRGVVLTPEPV